MASGMSIVVCPVNDLSAAKTLYSTLLGITPYVDEPYYVGFRVAGQELGLDPSGHAQGMTAPVCYWQVDDIKEQLAQLVHAGAQMHQDIRDVGAGKLIASVKDADGNIVGLIQSSA